MNSNSHPIGRSPLRRAELRDWPLASSVLRLIWRVREISRADIAREAELSRSTVSEIVQRHLASGLVTESGTGESRGGRRPIVLRFRDEACCIIGVEMGAAHVAVALTDLRGKVLAWERQDHPVRSDPEGTRALIRRLAEKCLATRTTDAPLLGIGLALPSPIDPRDSDRLSELVMPAWRGHTGLREALSGFGVPVLLDNDANLGALAERWWGAGRDSDHFTYVKIATGIGAGYVVDGRIYRGASGVAGEIGHLAIDPTGQLCICGLRGCLTTMVGTRSLIARATELVEEYPQSSLAGREIDLVALEEAAIAGDPLALRVTAETAEHLGIAIAGLLNLLNPARVILGGAMTSLGERLLEPLRETLRARTLVSSIDAAELCTSELGSRAIAVGAATMVLEAALEDDRAFPTVLAGSETA